MAAPRLPFLWPAFYRNFAAAEARSAGRQAILHHHTPRPCTCPAEPRTRGRRRYGATANRRQVETERQRYGSAHEPPPGFGGSKSVKHPVNEGESVKADTPKSTTEQVAGEKAIDAKKEENAGSQKDGVNADINAESQTDTSKQRTANESADLQDAQALEHANQAARDRELPSGTTDIPHTSSNALDSAEATPTIPTPDATTKPPSNPMDTVLQIPSPEEMNKDDRPPHLSTPPYVHHFDTWSLVNRLSDGGFAQDQSITMMKAVRSILASNMDLAREGLVSKSNVENESYLFRAAVAELRTEIQNNRKAATETMRTERTQLQHEVDILNQRMTQELQGMKESTKGWFDDRKMAVRMEQKGMDSKIQELNYKITVSLNSDARSEVEGLRWFLTRRSAGTIAFVAVCVIGLLQYNSYITHAQEADRKKVAGMAKAKMVDGGTQTGGSSSGEGGFQGGGAGAVVGAGKTDAFVSGLSTTEGEGGGYVSLG